MRSWKDPRSPWGVRMRFDNQEFETMMDELRARLGSEGFRPGTGVNVDLVLLSNFGVEADYVELPAGTLGRSAFESDGTFRVEISRALSDDAERGAVARRRLRTTLAHECGHVVCHLPLFVRDTESLSLFDSVTKASSDRNRILCRSESIGDIYQGEWWEYQANRCMAALLLPRRLLADSVKRLLADGGRSSVEDCVRRGDGEKLISSLSAEYDVSSVATVYRLQALGYLPTGAEQLRLIE